MAHGILSFGAYVPSRRIERAAIFEAIGWAQPANRGIATGRRAFAAWDEDTITMAVAAARHCLSADFPAPDRLTFATTTAPFVDRLNAGVIAAALDLPENIMAFDTGGSQRAGLSALIQAADPSGNHLVRSGASTTLVVAAEKRPTRSASVLELLSGDAGAALLIGDGDPVAEIHGVQSISNDLVDHYRTDETKTDYIIEERWYREKGIIPFTRAAVTPLLERSGISPEDISHLIAPFPNPALNRSVAKTLGLGDQSLADPLFGDCGYSGSAHALVMLSRVLEQAKAGDWILVTAFGQGCDAVLLRATGKKPAYRSISFQDQLLWGRNVNNYMRFRSAGGNVDIDWGLRAERDNRTAQTVAYNKSRDIYGFVGGRCKACKTPQFPKARRCVNPECSLLDTQEDYRFADLQSSVKTFTEDWLAFTREPPLFYGNVSFQGGGNLFMELTDFAPGEIKIGTELDMVFRIKDIDDRRGFHRYFWKGVPGRGGGNG